MQFKSKHNSRREDKEAWIMDITTSRPFDLTLFAVTASEAVGSRKSHPVSRSSSCLNCRDPRDRSPLQPGPESNITNPTITDIFVYSAGSSASTTSTEGASMSSTSSSFGTSPVPLMHPNPSAVSQQRVRTAKSNVIIASNTSRSISTSSYVRSGTTASPANNVIQRASSEACLNRYSSNSTNNYSDLSNRWLKVIPSVKIRPRDCDEVPEEFRRAGIGLCFGGKTWQLSK